MLSIKIKINDYTLAMSNRFADVDALAGTNTNVVLGAGLDAFLFFALFFSCI